MKTFLTAKWEQLIMVNYAFEPSIVQKYLPKGVELDLYQGKAMASLVGFMFKNSQIFGVPIPFLGTFEEVNLRFYVLRKTESGIKRGVVFINETVPYKAVAWLANILYKEHYTAVKTAHRIEKSQTTKHIEYQWKIKNNWNKMWVKAATEKNKIEAYSIEAYIFEHYWGYTKVNDTETIEYQIEHPTWEVNKVLEAHVQCDFGQMYGKDFEFLNQASPQSVLLAEGSAIAVKWKRTQI